MKNTKLFTIITALFLTLVSWVNPHKDLALSDEKVEAIIINDSGVSLLADFIIDKGTDMRFIPEELVKNVEVTYSNLVVSNPELIAFEKEELIAKMLQLVRQKIDVKSSNFEAEVASSLCGRTGFCCPMQGSSRAWCCQIYCFGKCDC